VTVTIDDAHSSFSDHFCPHLPILFKPLIWPVDPRKIRVLAPDVIFKVKCTKFDLDWDSAGIPSWMGSYFYGNGGEGKERGKRR